MSKRKFQGEFWQIEEIIDLLQTAYVKAKALHESNPLIFPYAFKSVLANTEGALRALDTNVKK